MSEYDQFVREMERVRREKEEPPPERGMKVSKNGHGPEEPKLYQKFLTFQQALTRPAPEYLVEGLLFEKSLFEMFGPPNHGKTFASLDLSLCIRRGMSWCGRVIQKPGAVAYVNADGGLGFYERLRAWKVMHPDENAPHEFYTYPESISLHRPQDMIEFRAALKWLPEQPVCVIFDTYSRCIPGVNENQQDQASMVVLQLDRIREEIGSAVGLLHHTDKTGLHDRGSSVILGACDTQIRVDKRDDGIVRFTCEKQRDAAFFDPIYFTLERVKGTDHAWLQQQDAPPPESRTKVKANKQRRMLMIIRNEQGATYELCSKRLDVSLDTAANYADALVKEGLIHRVLEAPAEAKGRPHYVLHITEKGKLETEEEEE